LDGAISVEPELLLLLQEADNIEKIRKMTVKVFIISY
jgi:hypothetical protein